ncbi:MAG: DUF2252 domain-containing protein [Actinomycetota bacterium]
MSDLKSVDEATEDPDAPSSSPAASNATVHLTPEERAARGKAARAEVPRSSHAGFEASEHRPDPVALLEEQAPSRVPELVPIRYGRMMVSPFTFYRGAALIMASDLAGTPTSGLHVQICGDAHLSNFGVFGSAERRLIFDVNDFDETLPGPWEWDVKRFAASLEIAGRDNGWDDATRSKIVLAGVREYREIMTRAADMKNLEVWYSKIDLEELMPIVQSQLDKKRVKVLEKNLAKARTKDSMHAFAKLTTEVDGEPRIISDPPLVVPIEELTDMDRDALYGSLAGIVRSYRRTLSNDRRHLLDDFRLVHIARKVVGVGSVGTRAWILLLLGRDGQDPLFLQAKEAQESVLERFVGVSRYANHGQRVVAGQRLMQASSDIFLGWDRVQGLDGQRRDFYIRQLKDWKGSAEIATMVPDGMAAYAKLCAATLARAHARSGDRIAIASYLGKGDTFDRAIGEFSAAYADQNERDHAALLQAVKDGRIVAEQGL